MYSGFGSGDHLNGCNSVNTLNGGTGADVFTGGTGAGDFTSVDYNDNAFRTAGVTVTIGNGPGDGNGAADGTGDDVQASINQVMGTGFADTITSGGTKTHILRCEGGNDHVNAASSAGDTLVGGSGDDTLTGGPGFDRVMYDYLGTGSPGVTADITSGGHVGSDETDTYGTSIEELVGSVRNDDLTGG